LAELRISRLLAGWRGGPAADTAALIDTIVAVSQLGLELGDALDALDINPVVVSPSGAAAVDVLVVSRSMSPPS
jgi:hypothetical protein